MSIYEAVKNRLALRLRCLAGAHRLGNITQIEMKFKRTKEVQEAQQQLEALKRIPVWLSSVTYFGLYDWWGYYKSYHPHMCHLCDFYGDIYLFNGTDLRLTFPRLTIIDENTIDPNVHPHCGCSLSRVTRYET